MTMGVRMLDSSPYIISGFSGVIGLLLLTGLSLVRRRNRIARTSAAAKNNTVEKKIYSFRKCLRKGWYNIEHDEKNLWVWSQAKAEIIVPEGVTRISIYYRAIHWELTGKGSETSFYLDDNCIAKRMVFDDLCTVHISCSALQTITLQTSVVVPSDYGASTDNRPLGICVRAIEYGYMDAVAQSGPPDTPLETLQPVMPDTLPEMLQIEITNKCNLSCKMCYWHSKESACTKSNQRNMDAFVWNQFLVAARAQKNVTFLGNGEPFCNEKFMSYLQELDRCQINMALSTNGTMISNKLAAEIGRLKHVRRLSFSIDSPHPDTYRQIRGCDLHVALNGLRNMASEIDDVKKIDVASVVMKSNLKTLVDFPKLLSEYGITRYLMRGLVDYAGNLAHEIIDDTPDTIATLQSIAAACTECGITLVIFPPLPSLDFRSDMAVRESQIGRHAGDPVQNDNHAGQSRKCDDPWVSAYITLNGDVYPCKNYGSAPIMGNLTDQPFHEIWYGDTFNAFRKSLLSVEKMPLMCFNCLRQTCD